MVVDDADFFGDSFEPSDILLRIILYCAIAAVRADSFGFVLCLRIRDYVSDQFAGMDLNAVVNQFAGGERGAGCDLVFLELAAQDLLDDQQARIDLSAFEFGEARFVEAARFLPPMTQLLDVSSLRQHGEHLFLRLSDVLRRVVSPAGQAANLHSALTEYPKKFPRNRACGFALRRQEDQPSIETFETHLDAGFVADHLAEF